MVGIIPYDEQPQPTPERPDFRRVTESAVFKKLPHETRALIKLELLRYDNALKQREAEMRDCRKKLSYVRAGLSELMDGTR